MPSAPLFSLREKFPVIFSGAVAKPSRFDPEGFISKVFSRDHSQKKRRAPFKARRTLRPEFIAENGRKKDFCVKMKP